jgi:hypothetical protein
MEKIEGYLKVLGKTFNNITTKNLDIEYCNIPTITNSICSCMYLAEQETSVIVIDGVTMVKIDKILNKYFRQNFIKVLGGTSIEDYIFDNNNTFEACFHVIYIKTEKFNLKKEKQIEFEDWILKINKHIERNKKFNRWNDLTIKSLLDGVTPKEYENEGIRRLINNYFKKEIKNILSIIHLNIIFGFIKSNYGKEKQQKPILTSSTANRKGNPTPFTAIKPEQKETELSEKIKKLKKIWLPEAQINVEDFIKKGIDKAFWNEQLEITIQRNASNYGTGRTLLGNIFIAFKGWAISTHLHYNQAGKIFCEVFNIKIKEATNEKYHAFSRGNPKQILAIKNTFNVRK